MDGSDLDRDQEGPGANPAMRGTNDVLLVIDDDSSTRYALIRVLGRHGWNVIAASSVAEGLDLLGRQPSCMILDLDLPDGDGAAVLRQIREDGLDIRVVVCTGVTDERKLEGVRSLNPDAIIHKPIQINDLLDACSD